MSGAHQLLFGYSDGHRLLSGSRDVDAETLLRLLGATDAPAEAGSAPLITGLPLPGQHDYAFCVSWNAPEARRRGAVWGHALLVDVRRLQDPEACAALLQLPRRPPADGPDLAAYATPLELDGARGDSVGLTPQPRDRELLARIAFAAYGSTSDGIVVEEDLGAAARGVLALWRAQWPQLRAGYSFRTRAVVRREDSSFDLTVAAKVRGLDEGAVTSADTPGWARAIADDLLSERPTSLREFLWVHGPPEPANRHSVRHLTKVWLRVAAADPVGVRTQLERYWPSADDGSRLKRSLFGNAENRWWQLDERARVRTLLDGDPQAWDGDDLELEHRARALALR